MNDKLKPREKLIKYGPKVLENKELMAILLRTGTKDKPVMKLAEEVLELLINIRSLKNTNISDLFSIKGISNAKATTIIAAVELGNRIRMINNNDQYIIKNSNDVYDLLKEDMSYLEQEHLVVLCLNVKSEVIKKETIYIGTNTSIQVSVKEVFQSAIKVNAHSIIVVHNHPSGDPRPSEADKDITNRFSEVAPLLSMNFVDHIIIGRNSFYSFRVNQLINT